MKKELTIKREAVKWWRFAERRKAKQEYDEKMELNTLEMELKIAEELKPYHNDLPKMFNELSALCLPSTPCTLENTIPTTKVFIFFGQKTVQFLRDVGILGFLFLFAYILCSLWYANFPKNGMILQALLVCAAGLGACFYSLNEARKYVTSRTFDDKFIPHYYNRITIGIIAGVILANFLMWNHSALKNREQQL